jgi:orotidine-5'-phosphate decarboxylase
MTFGQRLADALDTRGRLCVGIDPHPALLDAWGLTDSPFGLERFALVAAEALAGAVPVVKPQSAFFERHGSAGIAVLERTIAACRELGALVLLDVKRGDIGSTAQAYADAYLHPSSPLAVDAITVSPYLGFGSVQPMIDTALTHDRGVFVLAMTSNPEAPQFQQAATSDGRTVAAAVLDEVASQNAGAEPLGSVGVVVGATVSVDGAASHAFDVNGPILVPGYGAQGGTVDDMRALFGEACRWLLPSSSREILQAGPDREALHAAAVRAADDVAGLDRR